MNNFRLLLILLICFSAIILNAIEKVPKAIVLKQGFLYKEKDVNSRKVDDILIGEKFTVVTIEENWLKVKYGGNLFWLKKENIAMSNDEKFTGKVVVKNNHIQLTTKGGGKDNKIIKELQKGDIVTIVNTDITGYQVETQDGTIGYLKSRFFTKIGPMSKIEKSNRKFYQKMLQKEGKIYEILHNVKIWGNQSSAKTNIIFVFSIILFIFPMFVISIYVNLVCSIKIIPTWIIKFTLLLIPIYVLAYVFPIYFMTPLYKNMFIGIGFMVSFVFWVTREWKKIDYHRCPACHSMFATADKGKFFLGGWRTTRTTKYNDGSQDVSTSITKRYRDDRECLVCGHHWSIHRTKNSTY